MNIKSEYALINELNFSLHELGISNEDWQATPTSVQKALISAHQHLNEFKNNGYGLPKISDESRHNEAIAATEYDYAQLADIYNRTRVDYIIPMPMNTEKMREYCLAYDIDLGASIVAVDPTDGEVNGICMLGVRDDRTWITRLGVIPHRRGRRTGQFLMHGEIEKSIEIGTRYMQLEVIKGNESAHRLFNKLGFVEIRELLVIRRAPSAVNPGLIPQMQVHEIPEEDLFDYLEHRDIQPAWTEETSSLQNAGNIHGLLVKLPNGELGWIIFQSTMFQLSHFVFSPGASTMMIYALLSAVHLYHPTKDTKVENVPVDHPTWPGFRYFGYMKSFSRIEMYLKLA